MIPPHLQSSLEDLFRQHGIDYSIGLEDVQDAIEKAPSTAAVFDYNKYNTFDNVRYYLLFVLGPLFSLHVNF